MTPGWVGGLIALVLAAPAAAYAAGGVAIVHAPVECVLYDRYARIAARGAPADAVAASQLQFRAEGDGGWYSVGMAAEGEEWSAFLPRPVRPLARLEYRIVMRSPDAGEAATPANVVRVGGDPAECGGAVHSSAALAAPIVVHVPEGAPAVPPVPAGFSPAGVVAAQERARTSGWKKLAVGAGAAGGIAAVVLGGAAIKEPPELDELPGFRFTRTNPVPGTVLSLSRDQLSVFLLLTGRTSNPFVFDWSFELFGEGSEIVCVSMNGSNTVTAFLPATVTLTGQLTRMGACGEEFDVDRSRLRVVVDNRIVFEVIQAPLPFHIEP